jgi:CubicO group peptidase (beta-lactamase class C family)
VADNQTNSPWHEDTLSIVWSSTKGATALCAHVLASRGLLDLDAPVSKYWPEFAQNGKENVTVSMLLNHQSGVPVISHPLKPGTFSDWDAMVKYLAEEAPFWEPGTRNGYQALTFGWLVGEVVRRVSGKSLGTFFQEEIAAPLNLDFWIGLPQEMEPRVAKMMMSEPQMNTPYSQKVLEAGSLQSLVYNSGGFLEEFDSRNGHAAEVGAANGITNARGLAGMYNPLANGGGSLVDKDTLARMGRVSSATGVDANLLLSSRFSLGYMKSTDNRRALNGGGVTDSAILSEDAFGHVGMGGSIGFASPESKMAFGYTMNKMGPSILLNDRGQVLVDAAYQSLNYTSNQSGSWIK